MFSRSLFKSLWSEIQTFALWVLFVFYFFSLGTLNENIICLSFLCRVRKNYFPLARDGKVSVDGNGESIFSGQNTNIYPVFQDEIREVPDY